MGCAALTVTTALAPRDESARLVAVSVTALFGGATAGAMKSTAPETGAEGGAHGFEPGRQIWPKTGLPLGMPLTAQATAASDVFATEAEKEIRWLKESAAEAGAMLTATLLLMAALAAADEGPAATALATA